MDDACLIIGMGEAKMMTYQELDTKINSIFLCNVSNHDIFDMILPLFENVIKKYQSMYFAKGADNEDLYQQGLIGLYKAILYYNRNIHSSFYYLAIKCIRLNILNLVRADNAKKRLIHYEAISLDAKIKYRPDDISSSDLYCSIPDFSYDPSTVLLAKEKTLSLKKLLKEKLSPLERNVLILYLNGLSYGDISHNLSVSNKSIDNSLCRIRKKLKREIYLKEQFN